MTEVWRTEWLKCTTEVPFKLLGRVDQSAFLEQMDRFRSHYITHRVDSSFSTVIKVVLATMAVILFLIILTAILMTVMLLTTPIFLVHSLQNFLPIYFVVMSLLLVVLVAFIILIISLAIIMFFAVFIYYASKDYTAHSQMIDDFTAEIMNANLRWNKWGFNWELVTERSYQYACTYLVLTQNELAVDI